MHGDFGCQCLAVQVDLNRSGLLPGPGWGRMVLGGLRADPAMKITTWEFIKGIAYMWVALRTQLIACPPHICDRL